MSKVKDSIIIGASAAGLSAAIYLKRQGIDFLVIAKDIGGEMALSGIVENYPGFPSTTGVELTQKFKEHIDKYNIEITNDEVIEINYSPHKEIKTKENEFIIRGKKSDYFSKTIIIASGSNPKKLNIPGEDTFYHKGLSYCYVCDLPLFKNKTVAIIGGGNSALEAGIMANKICQKAYLINKNPEFKGDKFLFNQVSKFNKVEIIYNALTQEIYGEKFVQGIKYLDLNTGEVKDLKVDGVFVHIGLKPNSEFVPDEWGIKNEYGEIIINELSATKVKGIFSAGDVTNIPYKQIGVAVGQGIISALSTVNYLNKTKE